MEVVGQVWVLVKDCGACGADQNPQEVDQNIVGPRHLKLCYVIVYINTYMCR